MMLTEVRRRVRRVVRHPPLAMRVSVLVPEKADANEHPVEELTTNQRGQQLYIATVGFKTTFGKVTELRGKKAHLCLGLRKGTETLLNPGADVVVDPGDEVITIGTERLGRIEA